jgi:hypothetical protein
MRMSARLAAATTLAAMAVVGSWATAAGASDFGGPRLVNTCSNDRQDIAAKSVGSAGDAGEKKAPEWKTVVCQIGKENSVVNYHKGDVHYHEGDVVGRDATAPLAETVGAAASRVRLDL